MPKVRLSTLGCALIFICAGETNAAFAQKFTTLVMFDGTNGALPTGTLVQGFDANLYGTTLYGGSNSAGTAFKVAPQGALTTLYAFCPALGCLDGYTPSDGLALAFDGSFYGTTPYGGGRCYQGRGCGTAFRVTSSGKFLTVHHFCTDSQCEGGANPNGPLVEAFDGNFYGTSYANGIFKMTPTGKVTTLYEFSGPDGNNPLAGLIQATDGNFYGTTQEGGDLNCNYPIGCGTVFRITPSGILTTLHRFQGPDGAAPDSDLIQGSDDNFYGTTYDGGANGDYGTVFKITAAGALTTLYSFCGKPGCSDGAAPYGILIQATDGNLYGTTGGGATCGLPGTCGTIFQMTPSGTLTTLHQFDGSDGTGPEGLVQFTDGSFYGVTINGGDIPCTLSTYGCGTLFRFDTGLGPFVALVHGAGKAGQLFGILGQHLTGTTNVSLNHAPASFSVKADSFILATVPAGATTGYITVTTPTGTLTSNKPFYVIP